MRIFFFTLFFVAFAVFTFASTLDPTTDITDDPQNRVKATNAITVEGRAATDDYPYKSQCPGASDPDKWNFQKCQCTSFVAWRINQKIGINFRNWYKGCHWSNANTWDEAARCTGSANGVTINKKPKVGSIAQRNKNSGHVAWVTAVNGDDVTVEDYNWVFEDYDTRTVKKNAFDNYIHIKKV